VAPTGQFSSAAVQAVALSLLHTGSDTRAASALKALLEAPEAGDWTLEQCLAQLAKALAMPAAEQPVRIAEATARASAALSAASNCGAAVLPWHDASYPGLLREIHDPPILLWTRGAPECLRHPAVAVVGSRRATPAGLAMARQLAGELASAGLTVVSGLARGVDGAAHEGALSVKGRTVAVLGCGVDVVYPPEHRNLAARVIEQGLLLSEFPPGTPPLAHHFPLRNRIISGLVRAVVVIEAGEKSGSLITARQALEQGRDVLAVPGNALSGRYRGSHALIRDGAPLVETVEDVLRELGWPLRLPPPAADEAGISAMSGISPPNSLKLSKLEEQMDLGEPYSLDQLMERTGLSGPAVLAEIGALEVGGRVGRVAGGGFVRLDNSGIGGGHG
jgi:DNA processing protein